MNRMWERLGTSKLPLSISMYQVVVIDRKKMGQKGPTSIITEYLPYLPYPPTLSMYKYHVLLTALKKKRLLSA